MMIDEEPEYCQSMFVGQGSQRFYYLGCFHVYTIFRLISYCQAKNSATLQEAKKAYPKAGIPNGGRVVFNIKANDVLDRLNSRGRTARGVLETAPYPLLRLAPLVRRRLRQL